MTGILVPASAGRIPTGERVEPLTPSRKPISADGFMPFTSNPVVYGAVRAMFAPREAWTQKDYEQPLYVHRTDGGKLRGFTYYTILVPALAEEEPAGVVAAELAWSLQRRFDVNTAWLHMMFGSYACDKWRPDTPDYGRAFVIDRDQIIRTLGISAVNRDEQDARALAHIEALRSIQVQRVDLKLTGKKGNKAVFDFASLEPHGLWDIKLRECGQMYWDFGAPQLARCSSWQLVGRPGLWADAFLDGPTSLRQFGWISPEQFDSLDRRDGRSSPWPHILTIELAFRTRFRSGEPVTVSNADVIRLCGGNTEPPTRRERYDTRIRVENALLATAGYGCAPDFSQWPYGLWPVSTPEEMDAADEAVNGDGAGAAARAMPRDYWKRWMECQTTFTMPADVIQANSMKRELPKPKPKPAAITGEDVRRLREECGLSQAALAGALRVSQQFISSVERGKRSLNAQQQKRLRSIQQPVV